MISVSDIRGRCRRLWDQGRVLSDECNTETIDAFFPRRIVLGCPRGRKLAEQFVAVRAWSADITAFVQKYGLKLEVADVAHQTLGKQQLPSAMTIANADQLAAIIGVSAALHRFRKLAATTLPRWPQLKALFIHQPMALLEQEQALPGMLAIATWLRRHPHPNIYIRELPVEGVDTKFVEAHRSMLDKIFRLTQDETACEPSINGFAEHGFERRWGFCYAQALIRMRFLDQRHPFEDVSIPVSEFCRTRLDVDTIVITENQINGLTFPPLHRALVIFGLGYGVHCLRGAEWMHGCNIHYWGDIDTHGFAILDQLRSEFPQTKSLLMDRTTLQRHRRQWVTEPPGKRYLQSLSRLNSDEHALFDDLRNDAIATAVRLEQERIAFPWVQSVVRNIERAE